MGSTKRAMKDIINRNKLSEMSLDELSDIGNQIDKQGKLMLGAILLEARGRFKENIEFGNWRSANFAGVPSDRSTELMNLARFFTIDKPMGNIKISIGYRLSSPSAAEYADKAYKDIYKKGKVSIAEAIEIINKYKPAEVKPEVKKPKPEPIVEPEKEHIFAEPKTYNMKISEAEEIIGYYPMTVDLIKLLFANKAKTLHPDKGGNAEDFKKLVEARDKLLSMYRNVL